jgi:hypothetical protein
MTFYLRNEKSSPIKEREGGRREILVSFDRALNP